MLNSREKNRISFIQHYYIYRTLKLLNKWNYSLINNNNSYFEYKQIALDFKSLIQRLVLLYNDFLSLLLKSKFENNDSFNTLYKIGREIMKKIQKVDEIH